MGMDGQPKIIPSKEPDAIQNGPFGSLGPLSRVTDERAIAFVGVAAFLAGTLPGLWPGAARALTIICVAIALLFLAQYILRLRREPKPLEWMVTGPAIIDLLAVLPVPLALIFSADGEVARLFGVFGR